MPGGPLSSHSHPPLGMACSSARTPAALPRPRPWDPSAALPTPAPGTPLTLPTPHPLGPLCSPAHPCPQDPSAALPTSRPRTPCSCPPPPRDPPAALPTPTPGPPAALRGSPYLWAAWGPKPCLPSSGTSMFGPSPSWVRAARRLFLRDPSGGEGGPGGSIAASLPP